MLPYGYDYINVSASMVNPSTSHIHDSELACFFKRHLFQRLLGVFEWHMPETWARNYIETMLFARGYVAVLNTDAFGPIALDCGLTGYDVFYQPTHAIIANPLIDGNPTPRIGEECSLIKIMPDYSGAWDIVDYYGDMLALAAEGLGMNVTNSKLAYAFIAETKAGAEAFKKLYDKVQSGEGAVVYDKSLVGIEGTEKFAAIFNNLKQNFLGQELRLLMEQFDTDFDAAVGIPNANVQKNAHVLEDEMHANDVSTYMPASRWLESMREGCDQANDMFGLSLSVDWRVKPDVEVDHEQG